MRRLTSFLAVILLAVLTFGACNGDDNGDTDADDGSTATTEAAPPDDGGEDSDSENGEAAGEIPSECPVDAATVGAAIGSIVSDPTVNTEVEGGLTCTYNEEGGTGTVVLSIMGEGQSNFGFTQQVNPDAEVVEGLGKDALWDRLGTLAVLLDGDLILNVSLSGGLQGEGEDAEKAIAVEIAQAAIAEL